MDLQLNASWCDFWGDTSATNSNILLNRVRLQPLSVRVLFKKTWATIPSPRQVELSLILYMFFGVRVMMTAKQLITLGFRDDIKIGLLTKDPVRWGVKSTTAERNWGMLMAIWLIGHVKWFKILQQQQQQANFNLSSAVNNRCEHCNITHLETKGSTLYIYCISMLVVLLRTEFP